MVEAVNELSSESLRSFPAHLFIRRYSGVLIPLSVILAFVAGIVCNEFLLILTDEPVCRVKITMNSVTQLEDRVLVCPSAVHYGSIHNEPGP